MNTYTFIMEFRGGTYISQINANNLKQGLIDWCKNLDVSEIKYLGEKNKGDLLSIIDSEIPTPINTVKNVWHFSIGIKAGFLMVNIVKTDVT
ncbi:hypothetical protein [Emticicia sp. TH156]|uniref:hypothetical protein n=1 Tax=Emticicia sp. TH156 TaxID=2067454 RepID=UPI000C777DEF|nr:hypothetical protein [Emticicia sp. TH156]PLK44205.1 hypothetical protein C0V77_10410 [Emticicia sp. TH156]